MLHGKYYRFTLQLPHTFSAAWLEPTVESTYIYNKMLIAHSLVEYQIYYYPQRAYFTWPRNIPNLGYIVINHDIQYRSNKF